MKWLSIIMSATTVFTPLSGASAASTDTEGLVPTGPIQVVSVETTQAGTLEKLLSPNSVNALKNLQVRKKLTLLEKQAAAHAALVKTTKQMNKAITSLKSRVGKTWYVFSGSTPRGWDCSGLVMWTYQQLGIELEHSATKQAHAGKFVKDPAPGDIVGFTYDGKTWFYHVGLYVGHGKMIHAEAPGTSTRYDSVAGFAKGSGAKVRFIRIVDQLQPAS